MRGQTSWPYYQLWQNGPSRYTLTHHCGMLKGFVGPFFVACEALDYILTWHASQSTPVFSRYWLAPDCVVACGAASEWHGAVPRYGNWLQQVLKCRVAYSGWWGSHCVGKEAMPFGKVRAKGREFKYLTLIYVNWKNVTMVAKHTFPNLKRVTTGWGEHRHSVAARRG